MEESLGLAGQPLLMNPRFSERWGRRDGSAIKSACCCFRSLKFGPQQTTHSSSSRESSVLSASLHRHLPQTHAHGKNSENKMKVSRVGRPALTPWPLYVHIQACITYAQGQGTGQKS